MIVIVSFCHHARGAPPAQKPSLRLPLVVTLNHGRLVCGGVPRRVCRAVVRGRRRRCAHQVGEDRREEDAALAFLEGRTLEAVRG